MSKAIKIVMAIRKRARLTNRPVMWASLSGIQQALLGTVPRERDELFRRGELALFMGSSASGGGGGGGAPGGIAGYNLAGLSGFYGGDEIGPQSGTIPSSSLPVSSGSSTTAGGVCTYTSYTQARTAFNQYRRLAAQAQAAGNTALFRQYTLMWKCARNEMARLSAASYEGLGYWGAYGDVCSRTENWYKKRMATVEKWRENPPRFRAEQRIARKQRLAEKSRSKAVSKNCEWATADEYAAEVEAAAVERAEIDAQMSAEYQVAQQQLASSGAGLSLAATKPAINPWFIVAGVGGAGLLFLMVAKARQRARTP